MCAELFNKDPTMGKKAIDLFSSAVGMLASLIKQRELVRMQKCLSLDMMESHDLLLANTLWCIPHLFV